MNVPEPIVVFLFGGTFVTTLIFAYFLGRQSVRIDHLEERIGIVEKSWKTELGEFRQEMRDAMRERKWHAEA